VAGRCGVQRLGTPGGQVATTVLHADAAGAWIESDTQINAASTDSTAEGAKVSWLARGTSRHRESPSEQPFYQCVAGWRRVADFQLGAEEAEAAAQDQAAAIAAAAAYT
jgi:hypothetical protein